MDLKKVETQPEEYKAHVLVLPFHGQGHMNPMLQFSKRLASKGLKVTIAATLSAIDSLPPPSTSSITFNSYYDDITFGGIQGPGGPYGFFERLKSIGSQNISDLIKTHQNSNYPIKCLVYDAHLPWALEVAKERGILGAAFFTQACAAMKSYYDVMVRIREDPSSLQDCLAELGFANLGSWVMAGSEGGGMPPMVKMMLDPFANLGQADWLFFNSFDQLEHQAVKDLLKLFCVKTIGPTVPSIYTDKRLEDDKVYGFHLFTLTGDACVNWLNTKEKGSVVYISFGSAVSCSPEKMEELAWGLKQSKRNFLWVVRASEEAKLPSNFKEETSEQGLIVTWCSQLDVLAHEAIGCFLTHCGWNSTVEAVSLGVPMVAMPQFLDQFTGAKFVDQVWKNGVKAKVNEIDIVTRDEVEACIREVMEGERSEEIKKNACKWKELAKVAIDEGGSSDKNIQDFVARLV